MRLDMFTKISPMAPGAFAPVSIVNGGYGNVSRRGDVTSGAHIAVLAAVLMIVTAKNLKIELVILNFIVVQRT